MNVNADQRLYAGGERRQLWARDSMLPPEAPLVRVASGQADLLRPLCKSGRLVCPFPGCESPALNTAGGPVRRDHFRHVQRSAQLEHHPETYFHVVGKAFIADWLRKQDADVDVRIEQRLPNDQRPDVLATFVDGRRLAFEVQYAPIELAVWRRRHHGYRAQGITDFWFWGHTYSHLRRAYGAEGTTGFHRLSAVHQLLERIGMRVYWLDPDELALGTRLIESGAGTWRRDIAQIAWSPLASCHLDGITLISPAELEEQRAAAELNAAGRKTRWQQLIEAHEYEERARADRQLREEADARRAELRRRHPPWEIELPPNNARRRHPRPSQPVPTVRVPQVPRYPDPARRREVIEKAFAPYIGQVVRVPEMLKMLAEQHEISVIDFVDEMEKLKRDGFISYAAMSLTGGRMKINGPREA
jgi:hypothetical protein